MKKIFASLVILMMSCGFAAANIVYTTADGGLGLIQISSTSSADVTGVTYNGEAGSIAAPYWENNTSNGTGNSKIIFVTPVESNDPELSGDKALRFASSSKLTTPIDNEDKPIILENTYGRPIVASTNGGASLYLATGSTVREYDTENFKIRNVYTHKSDDISPNPEIKGVLTTDYRVYVLVARNTTVSGDLVLSLNGLLKLNTENAVKWELPFSTSRTISFLSSSRSAVGCDDGVYVTTKSKTTQLVSTDIPVVAICKDTSRGFYYILQSENADGTKTNSLYHYEENQEPAALLTNITGNSAQLIRDPKYKVIAALIGEEIALINMEDDDVFEIYTATELGGTVAGGTPISAAASSSSGNSASSSSGCQLTGAGLVLILAMLTKLQFRRK